MGRVTFDNLSVEDLIAMGDGLVRDGRYSLAKDVFGVALRRAGDTAIRRRIRGRHGLVTSPTARTQTAFNVLAALEAGELGDPFVAEGLATWLKTLPFDDDDRFQELANRHSRLLPLANWHWNLSTVLWAVRSVRDVPGDLVELGVFRGHTSLFCAEYVEFGGWPRQWWLYDTFEGIPADQIDSQLWESINEDLYREKFSYEEVAARFAHFDNIKVIKGRVPEILHETAPSQIAFMHIDMNNATAEIGALDFLFERISPGGIIVFDDYAWTNAWAQYVAEKAWFEARGLHVLAIPTGQGIFVKR